jgi:hypothetical protein
VDVHAAVLSVIAVLGVALVEHFAEAFLIVLMTPAPGQA